MMNRSTWDMPVTAGMVTWDGVFPTGQRPNGIHPTAMIGGPPEHRHWNVGDETLSPIIDPTALIHSFVTVDAGLPGIDPRGRRRQPTTVGARTFIQSKAHIGHNAVLGQDVEVCVGVIVCGECRVGDGAFIGGNSWIKPCVEIGEGAHIGGGSVVTKDVPPHEVWAGNPARFMKAARTHPRYGEWQHRKELAARHRAGVEKAKAQYDMTDDQWAAADEMWSWMRPWHHRHGDRQGA